MALGDIPNSLAFIVVVAGTHMGHVPDGRAGRFENVYAAASLDFVSFAARAGAVFGSGSFTRQVSSGACLFALASVAELYDAYGLERTFHPFHVAGALRLAFDVLANPANRRPVFQVVDIGCLPVELLCVVLSHAGDCGVRAFSATSRYNRLVCVAGPHLRARFAVQCDSATFDVFERMDMRSLAWISWTIDLVMDARADCVGLARAFLSSTCYRENVRDVTFEDEWARTVYDNLPLNSPMRPGPLDPFSRVLSDFVRSTRLTHIRLVSIQLDPELVTCLANASTLSQVTADRCLPCSFIGRPRVEEYLRLQHIAYLALGFGPDMRLHHATWALMNACPFLRHLVIFRSSGRPIACPAFVSVRDFSLAHTLETLHVEGSSGNLSGLFHLLRPADGASPSSSMLSCLKVSICGSVSASIVYALLQLLAMHHPRLRILVFEGVLIVRPLFVMDVCAHLPGLQGLSLFQRRGVSPPCDGHTLSVWDAPLYEYANALAGSALRHFQANFHCDTSAYGPRVLDRLVGLRALDSRAAPNACGGSSVFPHSCRSCCRSADDDDDDGDRAEDVLSIVSPFAAACTTLESFVVRAGRVTRFSCSVRRASGGTPEVHRVLLGEYDDAMHKWNPPLSRSWGRM